MKVVGIIGIQDCIYTQYTAYYILNVFLPKQLCQTVTVELYVEDWTLKKYST